MTASEFFSAFDPYCAALCAEHGVAQRFPVDADTAIDDAWTNAGAQRNDLVERFSEGSQRRPLSETVTAQLAERLERADSEHRACTAIALIDVVTEWPESEPGSLLQELAENPPDGLARVAVGAVDAMGQTGRADYADALAGYVEPGADGRLIWHSAKSIAFITGEADVIARLAAPEFEMTAEVINGLPAAVAPASPESCARVVDALVGSGDRARRLAAIQVAAASPSSAAAHSLAVALHQTVRADDEAIMLAGAIGRAQNGAAELAQISMDPTAAAPGRVAADRAPCSRSRVAVGARARRAGSIGAFRRGAGRGVRP